MKIWKFKLDITDEQTVEMPAGARILSVQMQQGDCCLWALCNENAAYERRHIAIYGTGNPMPDDPGAYLATFQLHSGATVFHAFETQP